MILTTTIIFGVLVLLISLLASKDGNTRISLRDFCRIECKSVKKERL